VVEVKGKKGGAKQSSGSKPISLVWKEVAKSKSGEKKKTGV